jgi:xylulokinase
MHSKDLILAIDVGTGSVRSALVDNKGKILVISAREHEQIVPAFGWSEQRPADWWKGVVSTIQDVLSQIENAKERVLAVTACGQMHGTVLVDDSGSLVRETAPLWNDKRTVELVKSFENKHHINEYLHECVNPAAPAWPGFKLQWIKENDFSAYDRASAVMMPKDYINFQLTGEMAMDRTEACASFLINAETGQWSEHMCNLLGLDKSKLLPIRDPIDILGHVTKEASIETGLLKGTPVLVGSSDYSAALLGSGVTKVGLGSEVMGTSSIITTITPNPLLNSAISNVGTVEGNWGAFMLLESGGDAMRWARRAIHEKAVEYEDIVKKAALAPVGSDRLFYLPYLTGERFGEHRNIRAQFFGLAASHGQSHLHRSVLEGVAFASKRHIGIMEEASGTKLEGIVASGGGAKAKLWMEIKASVYNMPILVPSEAECGIVGCAAMAMTATGRFSNVVDAAESYVTYSDEIKPNPKWVDIYHPMQTFFEKLYSHSQALYDDLDRLGK